tara:strand:+ start:751 stop:1053 length:303 start_codon:yes stop_codon:yes gene_type:complete
MQINNADKICVTRHKNLPALLVEKGFIDESTPVFSFVSEEDIIGKHVVGILPLYLASKAALYTEVPLRIPFDKRGRDLPVEELGFHSLTIHTFNIEEVIA